MFEITLFNTPCIFVWVPMYFTLDMWFSLFFLNDSLSTLRALTHVVSLHHSRHFYLFMHESECRQFIVAEENRIGLVIAMGRLCLSFTSFAFWGDRRRHRFARNILSNMRHRT